MDKKTEEGLRESEENYRFLVDNSKEIILILSKMGKILFANRKTLSDFGYSEKEIIGKSIIRFLSKGKTFFSDYKTMSIKDLIENIRLQTPSISRYKKFIE